MTTHRAIPIQPESRPAKRHTANRATLVLLAGMATALGAPAARAQVVTVDPGLIAQVAKTVTSLSAELRQVTAIAGTVSSVLNIQHDISAALGAVGLGAADIGGSTVGSLIESAKMGFSAYQQARNTFETISAEIHNLATDPLSSLSLLSIFQAINGASASTITSTNLTISNQISVMNNVMSGSMPVMTAAGSIANTMYLSAPSPTADQIEAVNATRRAVVQNAAITAMTASAGANQSISNDGQAALAALSSGVANASDERGDIKANSAIVLKIAEQIAATNGLLGRLLYLESAGTMATQGVYGPNSTGVLPPVGP